MARQKGPANRDKRANTASRRWNSIPASEWPRTPLRDPGCSGSDCSPSGRGAGEDPGQSRPLRTGHPFRRQESPAWRPGGSRHYAVPGTSRVRAASKGELPHQNAPFRRWPKAPANPDAVPTRKGKDTPPPAPSRTWSKRSATRDRSGPTAGRENRGKKARRDSRRPLLYAPPFQLLREASRAPLRAWISRAA